MKKQPRLFPVFVALSLFLVSGPLSAAAQVRVQLGAGAAAPIMPAIGRLSAPIGNGVSPAWGSAGGLNGALTAPSAAPSPLLSVVPAAGAISVPTPGGAATRVAEEAAAYAEAPAAKAAASAKKSAVSRILDALRRRPASSAAFDGAREKPAPVFARMGLQEQKPLALPNGSATDEQPTIPSPDREPTTRVEAYGLPGALDVGGIFETSRKVLAADPANASAVVDALRAMIDADPARYGVSSADLRLIHAQRFEGRGEQADTLFAYFRQTKNGLIVNGASLSFTIKTLDGRPTIVAQTGQVFPRIDANTETVLTDDQIMGKIAERTGMPAADVSGAFQFYEQKLIYSRGAWRNVKLYVADGLPFMVAVDVVDGLVFAWDNRTGLIEAPADPAQTAPAGKVSGKISGNTVDRGPILADSAISEVPMPFMEVKIGAKSYVTDKNGALPAGLELELGAAGLELTATLSGPYVRVENQQGETLTVKVQVKPGENKVVFNPNTGIADENTLAQINAFHKVNLSLNFLRERKLSNEKMDKTQLPVRTNIEDECNAYYTPGSPSLNFFRSSANCVNSAYDTVAEHENGHYWDDFTGGIVNGGLSEGWGDILSMFRLNNPIIGEHFLKQARDGADYIRNGENTYQYNEYDEVHDQGQAWGGFAWKLRKALMAKLGAEEGAAVAESLVLPTMFAKAATIPNAIAQVLVNATRRDGTIQHEAEIRAAAKAHGIALPEAAAPTSAPAAGPSAAVVPTWFDASGLSFAFVTKSKDGYLAAVLRRGRFELGVFLDKKGKGRAIFTKHALNPMGTPEKEDVELLTKSSRRAVAELLRKTQAHAPVSGKERAALKKMLVKLRSGGASN
ncbi:MAG: hypothetical protein HY403_08640 [Elusimicrobia bacterium]|nr:hypothetical protein [Elusimicrobiota bacterium]